MLKSEEGKLMEKTENISRLIEQGEAVLGLEFGSTRIKAVLVDAEAKPLASGSYSWENELVDGIWSYSLDKVRAGLRACYASLAEDVFQKYHVLITSLKAIGISGMMHGYLAFDDKMNLLVPFRTWRNTITDEAAQKLTDAFGFNIPQRWSIAHLYQAVLNKEPHLKDLKHLMTLAVYVQYLLTGNIAIGLGEASGMFPVDSQTKNYDEKKEKIFASLLTSGDYQWTLPSLLPPIVPVGSCAGRLTSEGASLLDESGHLQSGIPFCPPEGDASTGMIATDAIAPKSGNVSAGTSVFAMVVLDKPLQKLHREIDVVSTPDGLPTAMVHANNCCGELDNWVGLFLEAFKAAGISEDKGKLYKTLYEEGMKGEKDVGGLEACNYLSGEAITGIKDGTCLYLHRFEDKMNLANFMRAQLFSSLATLRLGMDILKEEGVSVSRMAGQGGFFTVKSVGPQVMSAALRSPVALVKCEGEGGPWGMAILALYMAEKKSGQSLDSFLTERIFSKASIETFDGHALQPSFDSYMEGYAHTLKVEQAAEPTIIVKDSGLADLKKRVFEANLKLVEYGLVVLTWGNVSAIDREKGLVVIKPSGVPYDRMKAEDMVVCDLDGHVKEGQLNPSSDTPTHLALYKAFPTIGGIVHTHSVNAVAFAQAGIPLTAYGTTHADTFYGDVPLTRSLKKAEIAEDYELNTGKVIIEAFKGLDPLSIPAVLVRNHGPFTWGTSPEKAVENALILETDAEMALKSRMLNPSLKRVDQNLLDKHYLRKHGKDAYYGQKK
jgi:L-ribulose-5-phosphate 4-epimerase